jgi:CDP-diacylglycerol---serine O-phosphatidyltransferase
MRPVKRFREQSQGLRRGVAILPSLFTVANMFCGYCAVVAASRGDIDLAVTLVVVAGFMDGLDGRIARMTNTTSEFGVQLDSLTDFLSFGVAPAFILYYWAFEGLRQSAWEGRAAWLIPFMLPVAGAIRLARFNIQAHTGDKRFFVGLAIPAAATAAVIPLWFLPSRLQPGMELGAFGHSAGLSWSGIKLAALSYVVLLSWLMVSRIRYRSFKQLDMKQRRPNAMVFLLAGLLVAIALYPKPVLLAIALTYAASGPLAWAWERVVPHRPTPPLPGGEPHGP